MSATRTFSVVLAMWGAAALASPPVAVSPGAGEEVVQVEGRCPTFSWSLVPGAVGHRLQVYRVDERAAEPVRTVLSVELPGSAASFTPPLRRCLEVGMTYAWRVGAEHAQGELEWSEPAWFEVAGRTVFGAMGETTVAAVVDLPDKGKDGTGSGTVQGGGQASATGTSPVRPAMAAALASYFSVGSGGAVTAGPVTATSFTGDGSGLSNLQPGNISGLTAGGVTFGGAGLAQDAANFFWDDTNNRLGLGTAAPAEQLHLTGNLRLATSGAQIQLGTARFIHNTGSMNTWVGEGAGRVSFTGYQNVGVGYMALSTEATSGFGYHNTAVGSYALAATSSGSANTAVGFWALKSNTTADNNAAFGELALEYNTIGANNTGLGSYALMNNTTASRNTAVGFNALQAQAYDNGNTTYETDNTAVGAEALYSNQPGSGGGTSGAVNTAVGSKSMYRNTTGWANTAVGYQSLWANQTGLSNTAVGVNALVGAGTGSSYNTALGTNAGYNASGNYGVFLGFSAGYSEASSNRLHIATSSSKTLIYGEFDTDRVVIGDTTPGVSKGLDVNGYLRARSWVPNAPNPVCRTNQGVLGDCQQPRPSAAVASEPVPGTEIDRLREQVARQQALIAELARRIAALEAAASPRE